MKAMVIGKDKIRPVTYGLALYFLLMATDCFPLGTMGAFLKIVALIPLGLSLLDFRYMRIHLDWLLVFQVLFVLMATISLFYSVSQSRTVSAVTTLTLNFALVFVLGAMQTYSKAEEELLHRALLYGSWLTILLMLIFTDISADGRLTLRLGEGTQDQNYVNGYIMFAFSYHCKLTFSDRKWKHLVAVLFVLAVVLLTGSRGAFIAYIAVLLLYLVRMVVCTDNFVRNFLLLVIIVPVALIIIEILLNQMPTNIAERYSWDYIMQTGTIGRMKIWRYLWSHFCGDNMLRMLFGHGYGTTPEINQLNGLVAHNLYLDNLITLGIVGLILQVLSQAYVLRELIRRKATVVLGTYVGLLVMCISLSLVAYKPIWNIVLITFVLRYNKDPQIKR